MRRNIIAVACAAALVLGPAGIALAAQAQQGPTRSITHVKGNLYLARNLGHNTVFLVTSEGVILADPINKDFSEWLRGQIAERFNVPVRYVIYSHHHWDHASGGSVFASTADFVGHYTAAEMLMQRDPVMPIPAQFSAMDGNRNGTIDRSEGSGQVAESFDLYDSNGDGVLTGAELERGPLSDVRPPNIFYGNKYVVTLGGRRVEAISVGPIEAPDMAVLRFPEERAVFVVDFMSPERLPRTDLSGPLRHGATIDDWINGVRMVDAMDYDTIIPGHGEVGTHEQASTFRRYLEDLRSGVAQGIERGMSLEEIQATLLLEAYSHWGNYESWRPQNIAGMYRFLTQRR